MKLKKKVLQHYKFILDTHTHVRIHTNDGKVIEPKLKCTGPTSWPSFIIASFGLMCGRWAAKGSPAAFSFSSVKAVNYFKVLVDQFCV